MLRKNCVLIVVFLYGVLCQDTNPEWLEPTTTTTPRPTSTPSTITPTTTTESIPTTTYPTYPTTTYPTTKYTTRYTTKYPTPTWHPTTRPPTTRAPTTRYPTTRYPPTRSPTPSTSKPSEETCTISLSKPVVRYYSVFGLLYKSIVQCCNLCCYTKFNQFYCRKIAMEYCNLNTNKYGNYYDGYDY